MSDLPTLTRELNSSIDALIDEQRRLTALIDGLTDTYATLPTPTPTPTDPAALIGAFLRGMLNYKCELIDHLFPGVDPRYRAQWEDRDATLFWCQLDPENKAKTLAFFERVNP